MNTSKTIKYGLIGTLLACALGFVSLVIYIQIFGFGPGAQDYSYNLTNGYTLSKTSRDSVIIWQEDVPTNAPNIRIPKKVTEVAWDEKYILSKGINFEKNTSNDINYEYYILDAKNHTLYGPLNKEDFENKRAELNVKSNLTLKDVYSYK